MPRCAVRDTEFAGFKLPAGTRVSVNPVYTHNMADIWIEPEKFDPLRFSNEAMRNRHKFAFVPFGGGAHMCLGLHFAYMQAKLFLHHMLTTNRITIAPGYAPAWQMWPIPQPKDGLHLSFERL